MENHKITIKNLGPIKELIDFEIKKFNLLIGKSAAGKSVLAKAVFLFNYIFDSRTHFTVFSSRGEMYIGDLLQDFFPEYKGYEIRYEYTNGIFIYVKEKSGKISVKYSGELENKLGEYRMELKEMREERAIRELREILTRYGAKAGKKIQQEIANLNLDVETEGARKNIMTIKNSFRKNLGILKNIFIPAARISVSEFDRSRLRALNSPRSRVRRHSETIPEGDITLRLFSNENMNSIFLFQKFPKEYEEIIKGKVQKQGEQIVLTTMDGKQTLPIEQLSSGQKEVIPILMLLQYIAERNIQTLLIIEEPEAHLFPEDQNLLLNKIAEVANKTDSKVFITTHSPILLMAANNLMTAEEKQYDKLKSRFLRYDDMQANVLFNGKCKSIKDGETRLVDGDDIEKATDKIMEEFDNIVESEQ